MRLVYTNKVDGTRSDLTVLKAGDEVRLGDVVKTSRGNTVTVSYFKEPHKPSSTGKVVVKLPEFPNSFGREFYVGVIGAEWIEREDQWWYKKDEPVPLIAPSKS